MMIKEVNGISNIHEKYDLQDDGSLGHGTAMAANLLTVAPDAILTVYKKTASFLDALEMAVKENDIISLSSSPAYYSFKDNKKVENRFEELFEFAKQNNVIIFMACGNGDSVLGILEKYSDYAIPVGGIYKHYSGRLEASNYARANTGNLQARICGLCGQMPGGEYIALPVGPGKELNGEEVGWILASGTSSATPQVAGVCALMKQLNPNLTQDQVRDILHETGKPVNKGKSFDDVQADGEWSRLVDAEAAVAFVKQLQLDEEQTDSLPQS